MAFGDASGARGERETAGETRGDDDASVRARGGARVFNGSERARGEARGDERGGCERRRRRGDANRRGGADEDEDRGDPDDDVVVASSRVRHDNNLRLQQSAARS